jgi:hypothetical protein
MMKTAYLAVCLLALLTNGGCGGCNPVNPWPWTAKPCSSAPLLPWKASAVSASACGGQGSRLLAASGAHKQPTATCGPLTARPAPALPALVQPAALVT